TTPNITYEKEYPGTFKMDGKKKFFACHRLNRAGGSMTLEAADENSPGGFFTSYSNDGRYVSYYGDNHPRYAGNVVKAMASAKDGYRRVLELFEDELAALDPARQSERDARWPQLVAKLDADFTATVQDVVRLTPTIVEVIVKAPAAARHFHPGQFYRLQNYERLAPRVGENGREVPLLMEGIALTGAWVDREKGLLSLIALEL